MSITVILPYAGQPGLLAQAIKSVFAQTLGTWQLLLVNDGADPETQSVARAVSDPRVSFLGDDHRLGLANRLNETVLSVRTPYVARMDADDIMFPKRLERLVARLQHIDTGRLPDVVGSRAVMMDDDGKIVGLFREPSLPVAPAGYLKSNAFTHPTVAGRTGWFTDNPYRGNLKRSQDKELWLRTNSHSRFVKLDEPLMFYRVNRRLRKGLYKASCRADREILHEYGPTIVGPLRTAGMVARSYVKQGVATGLAGFASFERRYASRRVELSPLQASWESILEDVLRTKVPGF